MPEGHSRLLACQGIGYSHDACDERHDDTTDVGMFGLAIDHIADQRGQRQDQYNGEQPDSHDTGEGIQNHTTGGKESDVLPHDHHLGPQEHEEHLQKDRGPAVSAHGIHHGRVSGPAC